MTIMSITTVQSSLILAMLLLLIFCIGAAVTAEEVSPETLFRQAVEAWQTSGTKNYKPFDKLADVLLERFEQEAQAESSIMEADHRLPIVGAMEESILVLERFIFEQQQGREEKVRDQTLSHLYLVYATALSQLRDVECKALALDPHTLLIGADTVGASSPPSTHLCVENAENSARNAATLDATNTRTEALLEKLLPSNEKGSVHERKPKEFVAELFDSFANTFDEKLLHGLEYKVPQMVGKLAQEMVSSSSLFENALDAGCGTGLAGRYLRHLIKDKLVGVDASSKMLDIAKDCTLHKGCGLEEEEDGKPTKDDPPLYDDLMVLDLEEMTLENTLYRDSTITTTKIGEGFDLIVAADVFVYFGSLEAVLNTFAKVSQSGATLIFTCEKAQPKEAPLGWRLLPSGRFAHTKEHVVEMAQKVGYRLESYQDIVPRMEKGEPVKGHLFGFVLGGDSSEKAKDDKEL
mmetsp:Transcript_22963/g.56583  ORF Transcript_22963/g.56583 Transcript_22963/m.56583 type:complete len:464 (-) Transcript_22963:23-1414(-)